MNIVKSTMMDWHIGCSGFHYKGWRGKFYPEKLAMTKWFDYYCQHFKTFELNVTFYRFPRVPVLKKWYETSPPDFRFAAKVFKGITHYKQFHNTEQLITSFYDNVAEGLQDKLGPILFQLPPRLAYSEERLERIIKAMDPAFKNVIEFRHPTWWREDVYAALASSKITFCGMSHPELPQNVIQNTPLLYYRFHGVPNLYQSSYSQQQLQKVIDEVKSDKRTEEAWFYFNNDIDVHAVYNAKEMMTLV